MHPATETRLPTGTVTFMFTDIEGSTRLLSALGDDAFGKLLDAHAEIVRLAIQRHDGVEVSTEGDAFFAVFPSALGAVSAAEQVQRALAEHPWPADAVVRVRMGLHSGEGRLGGENYAGMDVHRAARIAAAGHGGQVLLSQATRALVASDLPEGVTLRELGDHRLQDLPAAERLSQLTIDGLPQEFPPIRSLDARPNNLPLSPTRLVGREKEIDDVVRLCHAQRLLTITGPGGGGKTRLALAAAHRLLADFPDGAFFVALEGAVDRGAVATAVASALGVREKPHRELEEGLKDFLRSRQLLLVLDNFEQVVEAAPLVAELLAASESLHVIVTSRAVLSLSGEQDYRVPPLSVPDPDNLPPLPALSQFEAVALFIERARAVKPEFAVTNENAPAVAEICSRLDGLPLAVELAAARVRVLGPEAILGRLEQRLPALGSGARDIPARQRTLEGMVDWSVELLPAPERGLFSRLAVFAGGWTLDAAEEVCNPDVELDIDTLDGLASLSDNSLIQPDATDDRQPRFRMLQVIREFALARLDADPEQADVRRRHAAYVMRLVEEAEPELVGTDIRRWQHRLRREEENIRVALQWAIDRGEAEVGLRVAGSLWQFWHYWARQPEARRWLEAVLELDAPPELAAAQAKARGALAAIVYWQGAAELAAALYNQALDTYRRLGDERGSADSLYGSAWAAVAQGDFETARQRAAEAIDAYGRADDPAGAAIASAWLRTGPFIMGLSDDMEGALAAASEAVEVNRKAGRMHDAADWGSSRAMVLRAADHPGALAAMQESLRTWCEIGNQGRMPFFKVIASLEVKRGRPDRAVRLAAAAERLKELAGGELPEALIRGGNPLEDARSQLSASEFERAVDEGRQMTLEQAAAYALEEL